MQSVIPPGDPKKIVIAGKAQGYLGLAIHYTMNGDTPCMETAWQPTPAELEALNAGASIIVSILGTPPIRPMMLYVSDPPK